MGTRENCVLSAYLDYVLGDFPYSPFDAPGAWHDVCTGHVCGGELFAPPHEKVQQPDDPRHHGAEDATQAEQEGQEQGAYQSDWGYRNQENRKCIPGSQEGNAAADGFALRMRGSGGKASYCKGRGQVVRGCACMDNKRVHLAGSSKH